MHLPWMFALPQTVLRLVDRHAFIGRFTALFRLAGNGSRSYKEPLS